MDCAAARVELRRIAGVLESASDRAQVGAALTELALLARHHDPALSCLLREIDRRQLLMAPLRAQFFDDAMIDEALQDARVAVFCGIASFRGDAAFLTWLDRVATNSARQLRRRHQRWSRDGDAGPADDDRRDAGMSSFVADRELIRSALDRLSDHHREVIVLREIDGLSYDEMARRMDIGVGTVRSRLNRARRELVAHMAAQGGL